MSGINTNIAYSVVRLRSTFARPDGTNFQAQGTAFWVHNGANKYALVTNRHNIDPELKFPKLDFKLRAVEVEYRELKGTTIECFTNNTVFVAIMNVYDFAFSTDGTDVAVIIEPTVNVPAGFQRCSFIPATRFATQNDFSSSVLMMDTVSFIGFPKDWYDHDGNFPIARLASIASLPGRPFRNKFVSGNLILVAGLSFAGGSGSPALSHEKGVKLTGDIEGGNYVPVKVIGVMAGHFNNDNLEHSGLSYVVKSTSVLEVLAAKGF